jgi:endonuclease YncB( thermonuclease family)
MVACLLLLFQPLLFFWWIFVTTKTDAFSTRSTPSTTHNTKQAVAVKTRRRTLLQSCQDNNGDSPIETRRRDILVGIALAGLFGQPTPRTNAVPIPATIMDDHDHDDHEKEEPISYMYHKYSTANDIPDSIIESHQWLYGYVEKVMDGDTLRIQHVPNVETMSLFVPPVSSSSISATTTTTNKKVSLANTTIVIRVYGIDAPETAKKATELSQPFAEEAKQVTQDLVLHKLVAVKLLRRDKYNRIVGQVETCVVATTTTTTTAPYCNNPIDVSMELVARGLATLYTGGGAEYDGKKDLLRQSLQVAQTSKLGIWSLPQEEFVTPQEYKRRKKRLTEAHQQP